VSVIDDLKVARAAVENGWHQGSLMNGAGGVCVVGALRVACFSTVHMDVDVLRCAAALNELGKHLPDSRLAVAGYNDAPTTTKQDILDLFDKTLADLGGLA
jgi:hypothetical protein